MLFNVDRFKELFYYLKYPVFLLQHEYCKFHDLFIGTFTLEHVKKFIAEDKSSNNNKVVL